jgi:TRAP-type C4-dicarboxylate transport system substrate-binding protein
MPPITLRFGGYQTEASVHTRALRLMAADLTRRLGDEVEIVITANIAERGHKAGDLFDLVAKGDMDLFYFASSYVDAARVPSLGALDLPFMINDRDRIYGKLDGALGQRFTADVAAGTAYRVLGYWDNGFRHMSNRLYPIRTPADCAGLKMRTTASPLHQEIFASFGCVPMSVDPAELADAVATHRVDAQENPLTNLVQFGLYGTHKYASLTSHFFGCAPLMINRARYDALPKNVQEALQAVAREATCAQRGFAAEEDARCMAVLAKEGVQVLPASEIDFAAFKAAAAPIVAREAARIGKDVVAELEK